MKFPEHKCGLTLSHNEYRNYYDSIESGVHEIDQFGGWIAGERGKALETGEIWTLHWYPNTPVGLSFLAAASLEVLLEKASE